MLIFGIRGQSLKKDPKLAKLLQHYSPGGVILFGKNLHNAQQVRSLTHTLQSSSRKTLLIAVDQEGGVVDRLRKIKGETKTPAATEMAKATPEKARKIYTQMAHRLHALGFNLNFAPVVDLCKNPKNRVIVQNRRCFSADPVKVVKMAKIFIDVHHKAGVLCTLKHFPGHGSSVGDSHKGFTDVTDTWQPDELKPYIDLIDANRTDLIMSAHIFNRHLDSRYPATLSYKVLTGLLRQKMGFKGVIVSDDMQMGAIAKNYTLESALTHAVNAGCDMLLFGNQLSRPVDPQYIIEMIYKLVREGRISSERIEEANARITLLREKINSLPKMTP